MIFLTKNRPILIAIKIALI